MRAQRSSADTHQVAKTRPLCRKLVVSDHVPSEERYLEHPTETACHRIAIVGFKRIACY